MKIIKALIFASPFKDPDGEAIFRGNLFLSSPTSRAHLKKKKIH